MHHGNSLRFGGIESTSMIRRGRYNMEQVMSWIQPGASVGVILTKVNIHFLRFCRRNAGQGRHLTSASVPSKLMLAQTLLLTSKGYA
jgi:hypothetical protein